MFSFICALPSPASAAACAALFGRFTGTTAQSDFSEHHSEQHASLRSDHRPILEEVLYRGAALSAVYVTACSLRAAMHWRIVLTIAVTSLLSFGISSLKGDSDSLEP
jgi:hypothetical protein